ncbi:hypothetical protein B0A50_05405 [Salinomyces thailandicus]|uniref:Uncharacterized protein n=1 Tax=Salinomyces thailandicus TaxID=706561 RepID=A0A4U0TTN7_9PEZI|nr:hypothetical protein B0A50_05405 [Salinomyces thailandica]
MASAQICPVVGSTTTVLPPHHPAYNTSDPEARCPVTNAKVAHHDKDIIHNHPTDPSIPNGDKEAMDASSCPALKGANAEMTITDDICPIVGRVSSYLPPTHPKLEETESGKVCPVTNATLEHHKQKVHTHPSVPEDAPIGQCPVAKNMLKA